MISATASAAPVVPASDYGDQCTNCRRLRRFSALDCNPPSVGSCHSGSSKGDAGKADLRISGNAELHGMPRWQIAGKVLEIFRIAFSIVSRIGNQHRHLHDAI